MYRGVNHASIGQQVLGQDVVFTINTGYIEDYDDDEPVPTTSEITVRAQKMDLSKKERELLPTIYQTNKLMVFYVKRGLNIDIDSSFTLDGLTYTVVQTDTHLCYLKQAR